MLHVQTQVKRRRMVLSLTLVAVAVAVLWAAVPSLAMRRPVPLKPALTPQKMMKMRTTQAERKSAAKRAAKQGLQPAASTTTSLAAALALPLAPTPGGTPDYFGPYPNWANTSLPVGQATVTFGPPGAGAVAAVSVNGGGVVTGIVVAAGGSGYTLASPVSISGTFGTGATAAITAVDGIGAITAVTVTNGGTGYFQRDANGNLVGGVRKFVDGLPGLGSAAANDLGQYIPVAVADTTSYAGSDYYEIGLVQYKEQLHKDLPPTTLRGYVQLETPLNAATSKHIALTYPNGSPILDAASNPVFGYDKPSYLGPVIVAKRDTPVRVKFTNYLPTGAGGNLFIPTDHTDMGAGDGPHQTGTDAAGNPIYEQYTENRATLHLHGGATPWISDGTPHQWTTPAGETTSYPKGVSVSNVPDMPAPGPGSLTFFYSNQQSARLMFYHDHAYGITRLNVYAGEAAGYVLRDNVEKGLIADGTIPSAEIPLIVQDKTFVPSATQLAAQDPTWNWGTGAADTPTGNGDLWFPHVYMPNQDPYDLSGAAMMGRWDYGPWFWPPYTGLVHGEVANPYYDPVNAPWEPPMMPGTPNPSLVPEAFLDTPLVNGTAYPTLTVQPKAYRFRILNASNDRMWNLSLYQAASNNAMWNANGSLNDANAGEVPMVPASPNPAIPFPTDWTTASGGAGIRPDILDGRTSGVPDPRFLGPSWLQIGSEGGFLPKPVQIDPKPTGFEYNLRNIVVLNVSKHSLYLGPAERADVVVDFSQFAGKTLILYNDGPAPVPAGDPRNDYYTGDPDLTSTGGAPTTQPGYGPNTRTIMQIVVSGTPAPAFDTAKLNAAFTSTAGNIGVFAKDQDAPIVPNSAYNSAYNATYNADTFVRIQNTTFSFFNGPLSAVTMINKGTGYTTATVNITGGGGSGATATANIVGGTVGSITLNTPGTGYTSSPTVTITGDGTGATAKAVGIQVNLQPKAIQELFETNYGRMNATLGVELPNTNVTIQTTIPLGYVDPLTEEINNTPNVSGTQIGSAADGTQIWKITHNGVDSHIIHFHLFNVQVINRVGWDGAIRPPEDNELGWKESVRMNPLEDCIVALRPTAPKLVFGVPNSVRPLDPTTPLGTTFPSLVNADGTPANGTATITNSLFNFGWEYVWHCHLLGHEENDMMRPIKFNVQSLVPGTPVLTVASLAGNVGLTWTDATPLTNPTTPGNPANEIGFRVERAPVGANGQPGTYVVLGTALANSTTFTDTTTAGGAFAYRVVAFNAAGESVSNVGFALSASVAPTAPANLTLQRIRRGNVFLQWTSTSTNETGFTVQRSTNGTTWATIGTTVAGVTTYQDKPPAAGITYYYQVNAFNGVGASGWSNMLTVVMP